MRYRINQLKLRLEEIRDPADVSEKLSLLTEAVRAKAKKKDLDIHGLTIVKESVDARHKPDIRLVYTVDIICDEKLTFDVAPDRKYEFPSSAAMPEHRPVVAGFGPCGMFAALTLAYAGLRPVVIERGAPVDERVRDVERFWNEGILDTESNVQFGEGGAGTFSDGKLTTGTKDIRIKKVLEEFVEAGADESILYRSKPHIGTDRLRDIVKNIRKKIESLGGEVRFHTKLSGIDTGYDRDTGRKKLCGLYTESRCVDKEGCEKGYIPAGQLVLAVGHSARDTFEMLYRENMDFVQKPFSIGVRIEHPQRIIDCSQYGDECIADILGAADYKLNHKCENGRGVYTFCMCPGGMVIDSSSEAETAVTNGMSCSGRDSGVANSGLLVDVRTSDFDSDHPLAGIEFQRRYEHLAYLNGQGKLPVTSLGEFRTDQQNIVRKSLPGFAADAIIEAMPHLGRKLRGFDDDGAVMTAVETRSSSPVRIPRDEYNCSNIAGICPAGEGPGYAGGIMSAAVDGIKTAEKIVMNLE